MKLRALTTEEGGNTAHEGGLAAAGVSSKADNDGLLTRLERHGDGVHGGAERGLVLDEESGWHERVGLEAHGRHV